MKKSKQMHKRRRQKKALKRKRKAAERNKRAGAFRLQAQTRRCGDCKLCCYVYPIPELAKRRRTWCRYACPQGCAIHDQERPPVCTEFKCMWLAMPTIPERFRPDRIGCVYISNEHSVVHVVQSEDDAYKRRDARRLISLLVDSGLQVVVVKTKADGGERPVLFRDRTIYPEPPKLEELLACSASREQIAACNHFDETGESITLWHPKPKDEGNRPRIGVANPDYQMKA